MASCSCTCCSSSAAAWSRSGWCCASLVGAQTGAADCAGAPWAGVHARLRVCACVCECACVCVCARVRVCVQPCTIKNFTTLSASTNPQSWSCSSRTLSRKATRGAVALFCNCCLCAHPVALFCNCCLCAHPVALFCNCCLCAHPAALFCNCCLLYLCVCVCAPCRIQ